MGFLDLFRPKWRHSDATVRIDAVRDLDNEAALKKVAQSDPDARVRRLALKKIDDPRALQALAAQEADDGLRKAASERATELLLAMAMAKPGAARSESDEATAEDAVDLQAEALGAVSALHGEAQKTLLDVARRAHYPAVRKAAAERLSEPRWLAELARSSDDPALRRQVVERLGRLRAAVALQEIALSTQATREVGVLALSTLAELGDLGPVIEVAREAGQKDVALAALQRVPAADTQTLADIAARGKSKAVRAAAKERLPADVAPAPAPVGKANGQARGKGAPTEQELIRRARLLQLCRAAEAAAQLADLAAAEQALATAREGWAQIEPAPQPTEESSKRFARAEAQIKVRREAVERRARQQAEASAQAAVKAQAEDARGAQRLALCERVERASGANVADEVRAAQAEWAALGEVPRGSQVLERRFERSCEDALQKQRQQEGRKKAAQRLQALVAEAEGLRGNAAEVTSQLRALWREWERLTGGSPAEVARLSEQVGLGDLSTRLQRVRERVEGQRKEEEARQQAEAGALVQRVNALVGRLQETLASDDRKRIDAALKELREVGERGDLLQALPPKERGEARDQLRALREGLSARAAELREAEDWKRWANVPRLEALVAKMEALVEVVMAPPAAEPSPEEAAPAAEAAAVRPEEVAPPSAAPAEKPAEKPAVPAEAAAWLEAAGEAAEESSAAPAEEPSAAPAAEPAPTSTPVPAERPRRRSGPDLVQAQKDLRSLQAEWKSVGPAPKEKSEALWARFRAAGDKVHERCQAHFSHQREARAENLKKKEELVVRAEALLASLAGLAPSDAKGGKQASEALKRLQAEWKAVGPVQKQEKEAGDALWKRFRGACDQFFAQRKQEAEARDDERAANLKRQEELAARAEALVNSSDWKLAADRLKRLQEEWKAAGPGPRDQKEASEALWKRFRGACDQFFERRQAHFAEQDAERQANLTKKVALCQQVEALVASEEYPGEDDTIEMIKRFMGEWKAVGPVPKEQSELVWQRFQGACDQLRERRWALPVMPEAAGSRFENKMQLGDLAKKLGMKAEDKA